MRYLLIQENFGLDTSTEYASHELANNALYNTIQLGNSAHILIVTGHDNPVNYKILFNEVVYSIAKS